MNRMLQSISLLLLLATTAGCSSNFDREWETAGLHAPLGIEGRWEGHWKSEADGHTGALRCVIRQTGPQTYDAAFHATYAGFLQFTYDAKLHGRAVGDQVYLSGDQDLGWPVYTYHYAGMANPSAFYCTYHARDDHGYFALARSGGTPPTGPLPPPPGGATPSTRAATQP